MSNYLCIVFIFIGLMGCKSRKIEDQTASSEIYLKFGSGGGFTGAVKSYTLTTDGSIFLNNKNEHEKEPLMVIDQNKCDQLFSIYENMNFSNLQIDLPGNYYYFLEYGSATMQKHKLVWSSDDDIPKELVIYFKLLNQLIQIN